MQDMGGSTVATEGTIAPGQITVTARVTVTFDLLGRSK